MERPRARSDGCSGLEKFKHYGSGKTVSEFWGVGTKGKISRYDNFLNWL